MAGSEANRMMLQGPSFNGAGEWPFDAWLRRSLAQHHEDALREELPAEWLALVDRAQGRGAN